MFLIISPVYLTGAHQFGAVFLFILFESRYYQDNLSKIAFIISIPIFILSLIKIGIDISEDINDSITSHLEGYEEYRFNRVDNYYDTLEQIRKSNEHDLEDTIESIVSEKPDFGCYKKDLFDYYHLRKYREIIRSIRRFCLYILCLVDDSTYPSFVAFGTISNA